MILNICFHFLTIVPMGMTLSSFSFAETVGVFFDQEIKQIQFAAGDVKAALEKKDFTVEMLPLDSLNSAYTNKKVVIALAANDAIANSLDSQGSTKLPQLGPQAYGLRTMTAGENKQREVFLNNIRTMSYLTIDYAREVRSAIRLMAQKKRRPRSHSGSPIPGGVLFSYYPSPFLPFRLRALRFSIYFCLLKVRNGVIKSFPSGDLVYSTANNSDSVSTRLNQRRQFCFILVVLNSPFICQGNELCVSICALLLCSYG